MSKDFDGVDDVINLGSPVTLNNVNELTYVAWIRPDTQGGGTLGRIWEKSANTKLFYMGGTAAFILEVAHATTVAVAQSVNNTIVMGAWNFVTGTFIAGDGGPRLWIGNLDIPVAQAAYASRTAEAGAISDDAAGNAFIGNRADGARTFDGRIAHFSVWDKVLTVDQLNRLRIFPYAPKHRFSVGGTVVNLKGYWPLWESAAATALDHSGNGNNGTVTGTVVAEEPPFAFTRRGVVPIFGPASQSAMQLRNLPLLGVG